MPITRAYAQAAEPGNFFVAGKNKFLNGDFRINQRSFSSTTTNGTYGFDRWRPAFNTTVTYSAQTFTPGTAPVAGYEAINFARMATTTNSSASEYSILAQLVEDVRTVTPNSTVTVSFWAKAASGTPKVGVEIVQNFGSGGSGSVTGTGQSVTLSTSWARYSVSISVPSISGKTLGTGSYAEVNFWVSAGSDYNTRSGTVGNQSATIDFWGIQLEAGAVATPFTTATGTLAGELAACQRYFQAVEAGASYGPFGMAFAFDTNTGMFIYHWKAKMRTNPTVTYSAAGDFATYDKDATVTAVTTIAVERVNAEVLLGVFDVGGTPYSGGEAFAFLTNAGAAAKINASAEL